MESAEWIKSGSLSDMLDAPFSAIQICRRSVASLEGEYHSVRYLQSVVLSCYFAMITHSLTPFYLNV